MSELIASDIQTYYNSYLQLLLRERWQTGVHVAVDGNQNFDRDCGHCPSSRADSAKHMGGAKWLQVTSRP